VYEFKETKVTDLKHLWIQIIGISRVAFVNLSWMIKSYWQKLILQSCCEHMKKRVLKS
jgi:hypothetical protein